MEGLQDTASRVPWGGGCVTLIGGLAVLLCLRQDAFALTQTLSMPQENRLPQETLAWIRAQTPADSFFLASNATVVSLYTGRYAQALIGASDAEDFYYRLQQTGITHVVVAPGQPAGGGQYGQPLHPQGVGAPADVLYVRTTPLHDPVKAWERFGRWLKASPRIFQTVYENPLEAASIFQVKPAPEFARGYALYLSAVEDLQKGSLREGLAKLERSLEEYPSQANALNAYGAAYLLSGRDLGLAEARLRAALRVRPQFPMALVNLARVYSRRGRREQAIQFYRRARQAIEAGEGSDFLLPVIAQEEPTQGS